MMTNRFVNVPQNLTFIGTSNATGFQEIVRDTTGTRRFLALACKPVLDWQTVNATDWRTVWKSVDETAADPMLAFADTLKAKQETQRDKSNVEVWLEQFKPSSMALEPGDKREAHAIYAHFSEYRNLCFPGDKTDITWFGRRLAAIKNGPFKRAAQNGWWIWSPDPDTYADEEPEGKRSRNVVNFPRK